MRLVSAALLASLAVILHFATAAIGQNQPQLTMGQSTVHADTFEQKVFIKNTTLENLKYVVFACEFYIDNELVGEDFSLVTQIDSGETKAGFMVRADSTIEDASCGIAGFK